MFDSKMFSVLFAAALCIFGYYIVYFFYDMICRKHWKVGSRVVIVGASTGIGKEIAKIYAKKGASLMLFSRKKNELENVARECLQCSANFEGKREKPRICVGDITNKEDCIRLAKVVENEFGGTDILVLNAGISMDLTFDEINSLEDIDNVYGELMKVNYFGTVHMTKVFSEQLEKSHGQVVCVSTGSGVLGTPRRTGYVASKHALHGFFNSLRNEWKEKNITVTIACPGFVATNIRSAAVKGGRAKAAIDPERRMMSPERCAELIVQAAEQKRKVFHLTNSSFLGSLIYPIPLVSSAVDYILRRKMRKEMPKFTKEKD
ncbi:putative SDR family oxidoreductase [Monocercomonoides exilis]|uniref:putative SDR family oxidoreductase n=1 Tax=Monocercomonoides exilis TaxID=2049356 RepID=UPI00355AB8AF|nr:putative SDR family oxidoreductase [Monocercomonoides exilis]|eukprot:MONOS_9216.1-p1 / transcript=MONOS_9216.1 / gene=MONOS_9216 / organism=Monocercomonoides_exilis_PA203 / gene_product=3-oxoacyl- / transcript_product=3-oxoacyl- / location=Mono_scaffold00372:21365-22565(-) / protein_length=318 / sequence_SO=supercontig / SO=protein_coding / is_pseudo=false